MKFQSFEDFKDLIQEEHIPDQIKRTNLNTPSGFLNWINRIKGKRVHIDEFDTLQPWCICAIAALSRFEDKNSSIPIIIPSSQAGKFALAMGLSEITQKDRAYVDGEEGRTQKLCRLKLYPEIEKVAKVISELAISDSKENKTDYLDADEVKETLVYVIVELLRNVVQHSCDQLGAVLIAQRMDKGDYLDNPCIQIAVCDEGIGIYDSLKATHPELDEPQVALERSLWPSISGKFFKGQSATSQNAGMGLFFVSEIAKRTGGRFLISSRGASLLIDGRDDDSSIGRIQMLECSFPGTLVVFEIPKRGVVYHEEMFKIIRETAYSRSPKRKKIDWISYENGPKDGYEFVVSIASEDTVKAENYSQNVIIPKINKSIPIILNFAHLKICTQSYLHALLFNALKLAYSKKIKIYARNIKPAIKDCLLLLEWYSLE